MHLIGHIKQAIVTLIGRQRLMRLQYVKPTYKRFHPDWLTKNGSLSIQDNIILDRLAMIEIEVHSRCNRHCWMCPNSTIDRASSVSYFPEATYHKLLLELQKVGWQGTISFSRYNEPFADEIFFKRLQEAKEALPGAMLYTHTNGDFLTPEILDRASLAGLKDICIQHYASKGSWTEASSLAALEKIAQRLRIQVTGKEVRLLSVRLLIKDSRLRIHLISNNFDGWRLSRGGMVAPTFALAKRTSPCIHFWDKIYIDYNGNVMPCCHLRSDIAGHKSMILGNICEEHQSLRSIIFGRKARDWRDRSVEYQKWQEPCATCEHYAMPDGLVWRWAWRLRRAVG